MSCIKRNYEENFDTVVTYSELKDCGLTDEEIFFQWQSYSDKSWTAFKNS